MKRKLVWMTAMAGLALVFGATASAAPVVSMYSSVSVTAGDTSVSRCTSVVVDDAPDAQVGEECPPPMPEWDESDYCCDECGRDYGNEGYW